MSLLTLDDLDSSQISGKRVLVRVDFNVPLADGKVADTARLEEALPTLNELIRGGARVVLASHCGRPKGQRKAEYSLRPVAAELARLLGQPVAFAEDCIGPPAEDSVAAMSDGDVLLLENLRFHGGETANDSEFAQALAGLADTFVLDAFGTAHRAHASVVGVAERLGAKAAGRLLSREVNALGSLLKEPKRPFVGILGGAKIEGKIDTLVNLLPRLDVLLLGGGMANTFLAARGYGMANSLVEKDRVGMAGDILRRADDVQTRVVLPVDVVVTNDFVNPELVKTVPADAVPDGTLAVDVGEETRKIFVEECSKAATLFWNGPLGVFEKPPFHLGTEAVAEGLKACRGFTVIGGGETVAAVRRAGIANELGHVSTGGGASLDLLAGKSLPGVVALSASRSDS